MTDLKSGRAWSDERRKLRIKLRTAIDRIAASATPGVLTTEDIAEAVLEAVVGQYAWGDQSDEAARQVQRLGRRIGAGDRLEF
ncbi:hypothetical protein [uncultured Enterovirga sp.]|uniref:hypothetical protein n=1 Tax=uncultured Enterovirga sp. TaxID=2026352 RepID=UPI0035CB60EA